MKYYIIGKIQNFITRFKNIKFENNSYIQSHYHLEYSIIVTDPDFQENEIYPIKIIEINGQENQEEFNNNKKEYIGKTIYYDIFLTEYLTDNCTDENCSLCYESNYECLLLKPEYLSENPSENLSENYNNQNYPLNNENNFESLIFELESGLEFYNTYKNYVDLELLYSTIITSGICIIPYFLFSSFQNLRNIFFIFQFIIFIILTFNNKYKNH